MTSYVTPRKNIAYKFYVSLVDQSNTKLLKANPTIASGDFKVSTDGGAFANLATLPSANPASGRAIMIDLSTSEMNGDNIVVQCVDAAGAEWCDLLVNIQTTARQIDDLAFPATTGRSIVVDAAGLVDANVVKVGPTGSGTAQTAGDIMADTNDIQTRLPAALVGGKMDSHVNDIAASAITAASIAADAITAAKVADGTIDAATFAAGAINAAAIAADAITAAKVADGTIDAATFAAGAINAAAIAADAITDAKVASDVTIASVTGSVGSVAGNVGGNVVGSVGSVTGLTASDVGAIKAKTDNLPTDPADESLIIAATDAIMNRIGAPVGASISADIDAIPTASENADQVWDESLSGHAVSGSTGEALSNAGAAGVPPTAAAVADAVWDEARAGHVGAGSFGQGVASVQGNVTGSTTSVSGAVGSVTGNVGGNVVGSVASVTADVGITQAAADKVWATTVRSLSTFGTLVADVATAVWGAATRVLTAGTNIVLAKGTGVTGFNDLDAAGVRAAIGLASANLDTQLDALPTNAELATALGTADDAVLAQVALVKAKTDNLPPDPADASDIAAATSTIATGILLIKAKTDNLPAAPAAVSDIPTAAANADKLLGRNLAGGSDGGHIVTDALRPLRNRTEIVGGVLKVYEEDGVTLAWSAPVTTAVGDPLASVTPA